MGFPAAALAAALEKPSEIDCEATAIVYFLGLLFGFQRPSRCTAPRLCVSVPILIGFPLNRGGDSFIRGRQACQLRLFGFVLFRSPGSSEPFLLSRRGAASTPFPLPLSTGFGDFFNSHLPPPSSRPVLDFFRPVGRAFYSASACPVNRFRFTYSRCQVPRLRPTAPCRGGAAFITAASCVNRLRRGFISPFGSFYRPCFP